LSARVARTAPVVIVAVNPYALMYATFARLRAPTRLVTTYHSTTLSNVKQRLQMIACRPFFWAADCAVFVCGRQRAYCRRRGIFARRNEVVYNGIDTRTFSNAHGAEEVSRLRQRFGLRDRDFVIGISAWLRPEKNHVQLVDAVSRLRRARIPARALMIGDGESRGAVEDRARVLGVADHIVITGARRDVRPYVAACDVMVLCSVSETFSLAALEAMAMERPVIHSDLGGAREMIVTGHNGYLFPVGDTGALAERLLALFDRGVARRMGRNARIIVEERFAAETMIDRYEALLLELSRCDPGRSRQGKRVGA
jgi:glycosyltransferase involved in cell wall biosynthesis